MANVDFELVADNSAEVMRKMDNRIEAALEAIGVQAQSYATQNVMSGVPRNAGSWYTPKGASGLAGSIGKTVDKEKNVVYVGTNNAHAAYNEYGTGIFASKGNGRRGWWVYVPGSTVKGKNSHKIYTEEEARRIVAIMRSEGIDAHMTQGMKPLHFLKKAVEDHKDQFVAILKRTLKGS